MGGGGHAAVVAESARRAGWTVLGYLDDAPQDHDATQAGLTRLGTIDELAAVLASRDAAVHAAVGDPVLRRRWLQNAGSHVAAPIVDPTAAVSTSATLGEGSFIGPRAVVNARAVLERGVIVNSGAVVEHDCHLGEFSHVAPSAALGGGAWIGPEALVGLQAAVLPQVRIGAKATLGAGAVAISDVPERVTAAGVPAQILASHQARS